jgi:hypothetical protein
MMDSDDVDEARKTLLDLLRQAGLDRVEAEYDGYGDSGQIQQVTAFKGAAEVNDEAQMAAVRDAVEDYVYAKLGNWGDAAGSYGTLRVFATSGFATFDHADRSEEWSRFEDGEPGPDVPEEDRW